MSIAADQSGGSSRITYDGCAGSRPYLPVVECQLAGLGFSIRLETIAWGYVRGILGNWHMRIAMQVLMAKHLT